MSRDDGKVIFLDADSEFEPSATGVGATQTTISDVMTVRKCMAPTGELQDSQQINRAIINSVMVTADRIE